MGRRFGVVIVLALGVVAFGESLAAPALSVHQGLQDLPLWHMQQMLYWGLGGLTLVCLVFLLWVWRLRREIAARRQVQQSLVQSEQHLAAIMSNASEAIIVVLDGFIRFTNPAMERLTGYSLEELTTRPVTDFIYPEDRELVMGRHRRRMAGEHVPPTYEFRLLHREGFAIWVEIHSSLMQWHGATAALGLLQDISARRLSEENLRLAQHSLDSSAVAIFWARPDGSFYYVNDEACRFLSYSREELLTMRVSDIDAGLSAEDWPEFLQGLKDAGKKSFESELRTRSGFLLPVEINAHAMRLGSRELIFAYVQDISPRLLAQAALRESERRFRSLFEEAPMGVLVMDLQGRHVSVNAAFAEMLGYSVQELVGRRHLELTHPGDKDECQGQAAVTLRGEGDRYQLDKRFVHRDGTTLWGRFTVQLVRDEADAPLYYLGMVENVTERRREQGRLNVLYRAVEHSPISILITDKQGQIEYVNPQFCRVSGYAPEEALGQTPRILKSETTPPELYKELWETIISGQVWRGELVNQTKDGRELWENVSIAPVKDERGEITHFVGIKEDITERRNAEERLRASEQSLKMAQRIAGLGDRHWDLESNSVHWSDTLYDLFGVDSAKYSSRYEAFRAFVHPGDRERLERTVASALEGKRPYAIDLRIVRANGDVRHVYEQAKIITDETGRPMQMFGTLQDITSRKLAEQELADSERRFRRAIQDAPFPVIIHAEGGEVLMLSSVWEELTGFGCTEISTVNDWFRLAYGERGAAELKRLSEIYKITDKIHVGEFTIRTRAGKELVWDFSAAPLGTISDGRRIVMSMAVDVTERKGIEGELRRRVAMEELLSRVTAGFISVTGQTIGLAVPRALSTIGEYTGASRCAVYEIRGDTLVNSHYWHAEGVGPDVALLPTLSVGDIPLWMDQIESGQRVLVQDVGGLPEEAVGEREIARRMDFGALLAVPLLWEGRTIGFLGVDNREPRKWNAGDMNLMETLANILAQSLEGQRAGAAVRRNMTLKDALARLYEPMISMEAAVETISRILLKEAQALTGAKYGFVGTVDPVNGDLLNHTLADMMGKACTMARKEGFPRFPKGPDGYSALWGHFLNTLEAAYVNDAASHPAARGVPEGHVPVTEFLTVPVVLGHELMGQIALANKDGGFSDEDLEVVRELGRYFALAVQHLRARAELAESEERFRSLVETMNEGLASLDEHGVISYVNHQFCKMLGYTRDEIMGKHLTGFVDESNRQIFKKEYARRAKGWAEPYPLVFQRKDGNRVFTLVAPTPLFDEQGTFKGSFGVMTDITKLKLLENQLVQAQRLESIGQLAAGIAHEINTPSQYVENNTRYLQKSYEGLVSLLELYGELRTNLDKGQDPSAVLARIRETEDRIGLDSLLEEIPGAFGDALEGLGRITTIVRSVKQFAHPGVEQKDYVDLNAMVRNTVIVSTNEWKYNADLVSNLADDLPTVPLVQGQISQVILNLIINAAQTIADKVAAKLMPRGTITVTTRQGDGCVEILVADNGMGIPEAVRPNIFNPFFTTKEPGKGTGQGLAIAHTAVVEKHGGSISFETEEGQGTTFIVTLPLNP